MAKPTWLGFAKVVPLMIGLLSGGLGIAQQLVLLYSDNPNPIWQRQVFWTFVWIAFVVSFSIAWFLEHRKVSTLEAEIERTQFANFMPRILEPRITTLDWGPKTMTLVTVIAEVRNIGAPSIVTEWKLFIHLPGGETIEDCVASYVEYQDGLVFEGRMQSHVYTMEDALFRKGSSPIDTGDRITGFLSFTVPRPKDKVDVPGVALTLFCMDIRNRVFRAEWSSDRNALPGDLRYYSVTSPKYVGELPKPRPISVVPKKSQRRKGRGSRR